MVPNKLSNGRLNDVNAVQDDWTPHSQLTRGAWPPYCLNFCVASFNAASSPTRLYCGYLAHSSEDCYMKNHYKRKRLIPKIALSSKTVCMRRFLVTRCFSACATCRSDNWTAPGAGCCVSGCHVWRIRSSDMSTG